MDHGGLSSVITLRLQPHWNLPVELRLVATMLLSHLAILSAPSEFGWCLRLDNWSFDLLIL